MEDRKMLHMDQHGRIRSDLICAARIMVSITAWGLRYLNPFFFAQLVRRAHVLW